MKLFARTRRGVVVPEARPERHPASLCATETAPIPLRDPDPAQLMWMEELREFVRDPRAGSDGLSHVERLFRTYCGSWHAHPPDQRWNPNTVINALGVVLGDHVRASHPALSWHVVASTGPTTLVLAGPDRKAVAFPLTAVADRWMAGDLEWVREYPEIVTRASGAPTARHWAPGGAWR